MCLGNSFLIWRNSCSQTSMGRSEISSMFSKPITSPEVRERSLPSRGTTFTTLADSGLIVFATAPPQPAFYDLAITLAFVPGGPEPSRKGLGKVIPFTTIDKSIFSLRCSANCSFAMLVRRRSQTNSLRYEFLVRDQGPIRVRTAITEELPGGTNFFYHIEIEVCNKQFIFIF